jgi:hypothetical protein
MSCRSLDRKNLAYWRQWVAEHAHCVSAADDDLVRLVRAARSHPKVQMCYLHDDDGDRFYALAEPCQFVCRQCGQQDCIDEETSAGELEGFEKGLDRHCDDWEGPC